MYNCKCTIKIYGNDIELVHGTIKYRAVLFNLLIGTIIIVLVHGTIKYRAVLFNLLIGTIMIV